MAAPPSADGTVWGEKWKRKRSVAKGERNSPVVAFRNRLGGGGG